MSSFTDNLIISPLKNKENWWVLRKEFSYDIGSEGSGDTIETPSGFVTNFASIPKFLWGAFPPYGEYGQASVVHDFLYYTKQRTKKESDYIFYEALLVLGVSKTRAKFYHSMVSMFGKKGWKNSQNFMIDLLTEKIEIFKMEKE